MLGWQYTDKLGVLDDYRYGSALGDFWKAVVKMRGTKCACSVTYWRDHDNKTEVAYVPEDCECND